MVYSAAVSHQFNFSALNRLDIYQNKFKEAKICS